MPTTTAPHRWLTTKSPVELRRDGGSTTIAGYASVFNSWYEVGGFREIVRPGAFRACLAERPDVACRVQHEGGLQTIGRTTNGTLQLREDDRGLWYEARVPDTSAGRDIITLVEGGYIDSSSFAFSVRERGDSWDFTGDPPKREILSVDLFDVAPVDGPANPAATAEARAAAERECPSFDELLYRRILRARRSE